ncbi:MAG TPA: hypothetical protein VOA78_04800 [Candidatus Dormibacteraeota bacterium]|nr:hypothetical protein [Candidatus Dormibacteraeota bacterium]
MAPDDRTFEKALARQFRSAQPQASPGQHSQCADAETLAAYHERLLAPNELNAWKEHIAGCPRCQEILAHLEATDEIPLAAAEDQLADQLTDQRVLVMQPAHAQATPPAARQRPQRISTATWRWAVPAGAIAASLLVWVVWHENNLQNSVLRPSAKTTVAENRRSDSVPAVPPSSPADAVAHSARPQSEPNLATPRRVIPPPAPDTRAAASPALGARVDEFDRDQQLSSDLRKAAPLKDSFRAKNQVGPSNRALQNQSNAVQYQTNVPSDLKQDAPAFDSSAGLSAAAPKPIAPAPPPAAGAAGGRFESAQKKKERQEEKAAASGIPAPGISALTQTVEVTGDAGGIVSASSAGMLATVGPRLIPVPGTKVIWKIDEDGRVRRTSNLGDSWKVQKIGVNATMLSGSAPSEKVCWLVGTFGTVLLTTDAGAHWTKRPIPVSSPVDRITAFDDQHAIATLQSTNTQFETFDAGRSWTLLPKK